MKNKIFLLLSLGLIAILITSCSPKTLLYSNFNAHNLGFTPLKSIPNAIVGDSILYDPSIVPRLKIITIPLQGTVKEHKELEFTNVSITKSPTKGPPQTWLNFQAITTDFATGITYSCFIKVDKFSSDLNIDLTDGQLNYITRVVISKSGEIRIPNAIYDYECKTVVGRITDFSKYHLITFKVDALKNTYQFSVSSTGIENNNPNQTNSLIQIKNLPVFEKLLEKEGAKQVYPKPSMYFNWDTYSLGGRCLFNNVSISKP